MVSNSGIPLISDPCECVGMIVLSLSGRDAKRLFVIISALDEETQGAYVMIADGRLRRIENPKKKKIKHLKVLGSVSPETARLIRSGELTNSGIRNAINKFKDDKDEIKTEWGDLSAKG